MTKRKVGRPKSKMPLDAQIVVRIPPTQLNGLKMLAKHYGVSLSELVRNRMIEALIAEIDLELKNARKKIDAIQEQIAIDLNMQNELIKLQRGGK